ncbi:4-hydroxybenzoate 3-monooxygenase [Kitasatospora sp. NPDC052896]|uniref:4-hydroxybenzoate 3-monooxygenase n=1 Tax=Kitasatospora sp. NPDC052896 TaxID=3364061 RepID=UPI0037CA0758
MGIIGAGPAGLLLANALRQAGVDCVLVERHSRAHVEARARAGVIEQRTVELLDGYGLAGPLLATGARHGSCEFRHRGGRFSVPYGELTGGRTHFVYPQQSLVRDLAEAYLAGGGQLLFSHPARALDGLTGDRPVLRCAPADGDGPELAIECDYVAGCDGSYGIARRSVPTGGLREYGRQHEWGWLAVLAETPPATEQIIYALHQEGFAGHMLRTPTVSRFYLQCPVGDSPENWPDERIWSALHRRLDLTADELRPGPITERTVLEMRSLVVEPMRYGRLFLAGDAAHIITPAGAKGMNLAIADAHELAERLIARCRGADAAVLDGYSDARLPRIWQAQEFSHWFLQLLHSPVAEPADAAFLHRLRVSRLSQLQGSTPFAGLFARQYVGG